MIHTDNIQKKFGKLQVLRGISIHFPNSNVISIIGPNGSGKTTLIKCILGMVVPDKGIIHFNGKNIAGDYTYRQYIGYMPQIGRYPENMKIGQLFEMMKDIRTTNKTSLDTELIEAYRLEPMYHKSMRTLSGGTTQKVSAALAFLFSPPVLILDEPTAGLDPLAAEILKDKIRSTKNYGSLVIITSHIMSEVEEMADKILYLLEGQVSFFQSITDLKEATGEQKLGKAIASIMQKSVHD